MVTLINQSEPSHIRAIKTVGIGKKGSRAMDNALVQELTNDLKSKKIPSATLGAILGALTVKGVEKEERGLEDILPVGVLSHPMALIDFLDEGAPENVKKLFVKLARKETLNTKEAKTLGGFLFSERAGDGLRGLAASIMRMRYETDEEYAGLLQSAAGTFASAFKKRPPKGEPIITMAEPFDGVDHSYLITPLVADYLQTLNYRVVNLTGRNSGPKAGINLFDIAKELEASFLTAGHECGQRKPRFGWYLNQADLSKALDRWVDIRRQTVKRPFLATIERFVNPLESDIHIASAFHPPYAEKMLRLCENTGFKAAIIVRNGIEGTMAFPLMRATKILCTARISKGKYVRHEMEFEAQKELGCHVTLEEKLETVDARKNADLIITYKQVGATPVELFDWRVQATCHGLKKAIEWIRQCR
ncbi:MAG TPA: hypothetical protein VI749_02385 [Candidatus Omnitrophota bacterium]|nr:hypothetical protein [Candidatus Omnitrophota bacterium]